MNAIEALRLHKIDQDASPSTLEILEQKCRHMLAFFGEPRPVDTIKLEDTVAYVRHRRAGSETRAPVADATIELELRELRAALRWLKRCGLYDGEPAAIWPGDILQPSPKRKRWLPISEFRQLWIAMGGAAGYWRAGQWCAFDKTRGLDWRDHLTVHCYVGLRLSELYRLEASDLDGEHLLVRGTKTAGAVRRVPLGPEALEVLRRAHPSGPLFPLTSPNWKAQKRAWDNALKRACKRAQLAPASTNDLRRTFATWAWQAGVPESLLVRWMGHASSRMIREVYAQSSDEHDREQIARLPSAGNLPRISHDHGQIAAIGSTSRNQKTK